ncbi:MAG TPA: oxygen-independent coproporphyrinogen III oxidase [Balneolaceae bacterium]|nr:oxygen-independent coproporphyrinogen III oxidase [Balneolaceae bacterium]
MKPEINLELIQKYNRPGPRYTSYPTALKLKKLEDHKSLKKYLSAVQETPGKISLYFHIPFCQSLCWYCGCTKVISKNHEDADLYLNYLEKEISRVKEVINPDSDVVQIHFGGGTPTFLTPGQLRRLGTLIRSNFKVDRHAEFGVEIDPRWCTEEHIRALAEIGCNRASIGVQDTNEEVQKAIHRIQPVDETRRVVDCLKNHGISSINLDLIYGLAKQTPKTFKKTLKDALALNPDRLAVYSYAHLPERMPAQRLLNKDDLPSTSEKLEMMRLAIEFLTSNRYHYIGMDHFSKDGDGLSKALRNGSLHRNFQGYSTHAETDLYGFGMSSISQIGNRVYQNARELQEYYKRLDNDEWPVAKAMTLNHDDSIRKDVIMKIMCQPVVDFAKLSKLWQIDSKEYFKSEFDRLLQLEDDGLVLTSGNTLIITERGRLFLRNIAMIFDAYLSDSIRIRYSQTV